MSASGELVRLGAGLADVSIRDALWYAIDESRLPGRALWWELGRRLPSPFDAPPLFLLAWASWRAGDGALADIAVDRVLRSDPEYSAGHVLRTVLRSGLDPFTVPRLRRGARLRRSA